MKKVYTLILMFIFGSFTSPVFAAGDDSVLVRIGNKTISLNEFIMRSEYTVRPVYCRGNTNLDKKVILNSLIAEKLLALEAGDNNEFINKEEVKTYLLGRKEQAMRLALYNDEVKSKILPDTSRIMKVFDNAGREYQLQYANIRDSVTAQGIVDEMNFGDVQFSVLMAGKYGVNEIPERKVAWNDLEHPAVLEALFTRNLKKGETIGPVKTAENEYLVIHIMNWTDTPVITEKQRADRFNMVNSTYEKAEIKKAFEVYIRKIMNNKELVFEKNTFTSLADIIGPVYMKSKEEREEELKQNAWTLSEETGQYDKIKPGLDQIRNELLFTIDGKKWTVDECLKYMRRHPLVFREKTFPQEEFGFQFQMALIDMIRDKYMTEDAYKKGYEKLPAVVHDNDVWKDNINAAGEKFRILKEAGTDSLWGKDYLNIIEKILNPRINDLQKKYSDKIFINTELFNNIKLTRVDMALTWSALPFVRVVPDFPVLTTDNKLNYGNALK